MQLEVNYLSNQNSFSNAIPEKSESKGFSLFKVRIKIGSGKKMGSAITHHEKIGSGPKSVIGTSLVPSSKGRTTK